MQNIVTWEQIQTANKREDIYLGFLDVSFSS